MIEVKNLSRYYGARRVVDDISFSLAKGDVLGFIGPNGAGKSTTMRMITGFIPPSSGSVSICGFDMSESPLEAKARIGYLPENAPLYNNMTVTEFLVFCAKLRGLSGKELDDRVGAVLDMCFLRPVANQCIETLSKGYKHRSCFAQSVIHDPDVLILDEPTDGLDPNQKREIRSLVRRMGESKAIIVSTHILEELETVCNRVLVISSGRKLFEGSPAEFKASAPDAGLIRIYTLLPLSESAIRSLKEKIAFAKLQFSENFAENLPSIICKPEAGRSDEALRIAMDVLNSERAGILKTELSSGSPDESFRRLTQSADERS